MTEPATQHGRSRDDRADTQPGTPEGRRAVDLLWAPTQQPSIRGPKPRTSLAEVIAAGVAIADAEGLAALSIRKVASRLGIGAMSIYTYVPGRSELVELMIDHVYEEHALPRSGAALAAASRTMGPRNVAHLRTHPWLLDYNMARLPIGPHVLDVSESLYAALHAAGFIGAENVAITNLIQWQLHWRGSFHDQRRRRGAAYRGFRRGLLGFPRQLLGHLLRLGPLSDHGGDLGGRRVRRSGWLGLRAHAEPVADWRRRTSGPHGA